MPDFKDLFFRKGKFSFKNLFYQIPLSEESEEHQELPSKMVSCLTQEIRNLAIPSEYIEGLQSSLEDALTRWQEEEEAANELVILGSPVEPLFKIIREALNNLQLLNDWKISSLSFSTRPDKFFNIAKLLETELGIDSKVNARDNREKLKEIVVIPSVELCFLRHIAGLDAIEYLRELIFQDRSRLWLIGCNNLTWQYLDVIYRITAYFERTITLPKLQGDTMRQTLMPLLANNNIKLNWEKESSEEREKKLKNYFDRLADISEGSLAVAGELWWRSLFPVSQKEEAGNSEEQETKIKHNEVKLGKAKAPNLPDLTAEERYLIFSILLHQKISLQHLALSLGDPESTVQFVLQKLLQTGIIKRDRLFFYIDSVYYPSLKNYFKNNNFITGI